MNAVVRGPGTARKILEAYLEREDRVDWLVDHAKKLLEAMEFDPRRVSALVLGDQTPRGKPTFEALLAEAHPPKIPKPVRRSGRTLDWDEIPSSEISTFRDLPPETRPSEKLTLVEQGPEGGPETPSSEYRHHKLRYPTLNAVQSLVLQWVDRDVNLVVATSTSSGKSISAEMIMGEGLSRGGKALFLSPLKAVSQEKFDEWTDQKHPWSKRKVEILTGDYQVTPARRRALKVADIVVLTSESLDSRSRRIEAEESGFLMAAAVAVIDEAHLLTTEGRGSALEAGIMRFSKRNPRARIVLLSATMPNTDELGRWLTSLNGRPTVVIRSDWRPTKLTVWWPTYKETRTYIWDEQAKREGALAIIRRFPKDKFLVFVHSKKAGYALVDRLNECLGEGKTEFHNADVPLEKRLKLEKDFKGSGGLRVVVATSSLCYGVNLPARRVIILGVHRGMDEVDAIDVKQMAGRAGRYGLDPAGDAYILLPDRRAALFRAKYEKIEKITSRLNDEDTLAFHLTAEVAEGGVSTEAAAVAWHARSFAAFQGRPLAERGPQLAPAGTPEYTAQVMRGEADRLSAAKVMEKLGRVGIFRVDEIPDPTCPVCCGNGAGPASDVPCERCGGDGQDRPEIEWQGPQRPPVRHYEATQLGRVSSWLYFSPFDIADWCTNFRKLVERDRQREDDCIAWALGHVKTSFGHYTPREIEKSVSQFGERLRSRGIEYLRLPPAVIAYRHMLRGEELLPVAAIQRGLRHDTDRIMQALTLIDERVLRMLGSEYLELLRIRLIYGVGWPEAGLCRLPGIGAKRAGALIRRGVTSIAAVLERPTRVRGVLPKSIADEVFAAAKKMLGTD